MDHQHIPTVGSAPEQCRDEEAPLLPPSPSTQPSSPSSSSPRPPPSVRRRLTYHFGTQSPDDETRHHAVMRGRFGFDPTLATSVLLGLVCGTLYGFGRYSRDLKGALGLSQTQLENLGIMMDLGNYMGHPLTGYVYDAFGPRASCLLAAIVVFGSYAEIHSAVASLRPGDSVNTLLLGTFFGLVGLGSGLGYIAALASTTKKFQGSARAGRAVGIVAAGYGLCSTLVGLTYNWFGLERFFLVWAFLVAAVNVLGASLFPPATSDRAVASAELSERLDVDAREQGGWTTWRRWTYWVLFYSFACATGCGLFIINNLSTMAESLEGTDSLAEALIYILSVCNCAGRIIVGAVLDTGRWSKLSLLRFVLLIIAAALLLSSVEVHSLDLSRAFLVATVSLVAMSYGACWVLIVGILTESYGKKHFGKDYGVMALGPALLGWAFNAASAWIYEKHAASDDGEGGSDNVCVGASCYMSSFLLTAAAALSGALLLSLLDNSRGNNV